MKAMRERRRAKGLREVRLVVPDARDPAVRARVCRGSSEFESAARSRSDEVD
jgi:antidote-toxin recognition MazE-like antitoxin